LSLLDQLHNLQVARSLLALAIGKENYIRVEDSFTSDNSARDIIC
jgi:hypothetical protein